VHDPGKADLNVYAYVSGKPLRMVDPLGLEGVPKDARGRQGTGYTFGPGGKRTTFKMPRREPKHQRASTPPPERSNTSIGENLTILSAFATLEPPVNNENGEKLGAFGGGCTGDSCIRSEAAQIGAALVNIFGAVWGAAKGVVQGIRKGTEAGTRELLETAAQHLDDLKATYVNLAGLKQTQHILYGDRTGGGHLFPGNPGKSPFPADWSAEKAMHEISSVARDPASKVLPGRGGRTLAQGTRDGIDITVVLEAQKKGGGIVTGFPTNVPRNP